MPREPRELGRVERWRVCGGKIEVKLRGSYLENRRQRGTGAYEGATVRSDLGQAPAAMCVCVSVIMLCLGSVAQVTIKGQADVPVLLI